MQFEKSGAAMAAADLNHRYLWGPQVDQILADEYLSLGVGGGGSPAPPIGRRTAGPIAPGPRPLGLDQPHRPLAALRPPPFGPRHCDL